MIEDIPKNIECCKISGYDGLWEYRYFLAHKRAYFFTQRRSNGFARRILVSQKSINDVVILDYVKTPLWKTINE